MSDQIIGGENHDNISSAGRQKTILLDDSVLGRAGQRMYECTYGGGAPSRGCEVYVTRIPRDCFEAELLPVFSRVGPIFEHRLMMEQNGLNRGYAYIKFTNPQDAKEAVKRLNNYEIRPSRHLVVTKSVDNRRLWVNGIPKNRSGQEIRLEMERLTGGVRDIILYPSQADKTKSRGYMFVEYESHRAAAMARKKLIKGNFHIYGQEIGTVDWAEPEHDVDEETMSTVKILFVRNLMLSTTESTLRDLFIRLSEGDIDTIERVKKTKDYAFVHFSSRAAAEKALSGCKDLKIDEAEVEVVWSKPVDKQTYNTRKALTKVFTVGAISQDQGGPRRRGAAGIRGLGAPGTTPPKQLVQRYASMTPGSVPVSPAARHVSYKSAVEHLQDIALANGWGEPVYTAVATEPGDNAPDKFCFKVTLPSIALPAPHNSFQPNIWRHSEEEARSEAATMVLTLLRLSPDHRPLDTLHPAPLAHPAPLYTPLTHPAHPGHALHGVPLTTAGAWPGGFTVPTRLAPYNDPYTSAYVSMLTSMYGLSIAV